MTDDRPANATWTRKYWDIVDQIFWSPRYLGLGSIPKRHWRVEGDRISVPAELVNKAGPLYTRRRRSKELRDYLHTQEEVLNHVFDITFAIAPDSVIERLFLAPLGFADKGPFESLVAEMAERYGWAASENVTQTDAVFVTARTLATIELKLGSPTWPEQIAKYAAVMHWEEQKTGPRDRLGLLYIVPAPALATHWSKCKLAGPKVDRTYIDVLNRAKLPRRVRDLFENKHERKKMADILDRLHQRIE